MRKSKNTISVFGNQKRLNKHLTSKILQKNKTIKQISSRELYYKGKATRFEKCYNAAVEEAKKHSGKVPELQQEIQKLKRSLGNVLTENEVLKDKDQPEVFESFDGYKFSTAMQKLVFCLLENHVSSAKIGSVFECFAAFFNFTISHIPSESTINNMNLRLLLSQKQLAEEFSSKEDLTLLSDETTKIY